MTRSAIFGILSLLLFTGPATADPAADGLRAELDRNMAELSLPDAPSPYFISYELMDTWDISVIASLGGIIEDSRQPERQLGVAVRVGSPELDNGNFKASWQSDGFVDGKLVLADLALPLQHDAWLLTDKAYKGALENLARKEAARRNKAKSDRPPDFTLVEPQVHQGEAAPAGDGERLMQLARELSAVFLQHSGVEASRVYGVSSCGRRVTLDSGGTQVARPYRETDLRVVASARAEDGSTVWDHASWTVSTLDDLPPQEEMLAATQDLAQRLEAWRELPAAEEEYVGPVIFEDQAALSLFRVLLLPYLSGTAALEKGKTRWGSRDDSRPTLRLRRRVLPQEFHVVDDPLADPDLPSSYAYDDEGQPAQRVSLVEDGVVRGLLASRTPGKDVAESNGHARGFPGELLRGMPSWVVVRADAQRSERRMSKQALRLAQDYEQDFVLVVRRIGDPSIPFGARHLRRHRSSDGPPEMPAPVELLRRYADGREEPVRGYRFEGLDRRALRDIVAAGEGATDSFLMTPDSDPYGSGATYGLPVSLTAPAVLISEVVLQPDEGSGEKAPLVPSPLER